MIIYGKQVCLYALENYTKNIETVYVAKRGILPQGLYEQYKGKIKFLENRWAQAMSKGGNHQGLLVEMSDFETTSFEEIKRGEFIIVLDGLTDVGNIGAIVRTAYALGVDGIIASGVKKLNFGAIARSSSGALLDMPFIIEQNPLYMINELKQLGFVTYGAAMEGEAIESSQFAKKRVLILGSENKGLSKKIRQKLDKTISISMKRDFDSLNVSVAGAIMIHRMSYGIK